MMWIASIDVYGKKIGDEDVNTKERTLDPSVFIGSKLMLQTRQTNSDLLVEIVGISRGKFIIKRVSNGS